MVHDAASNRWLIHRNPFDREHETLSTQFTCIFHRPGEQSGSLNTTVMPFLNPSCRWYNNLLVIAHDESGHLMDMDERLKQTFLHYFTK